MGLVIHSLTLDGTTTNVATVRQLGCTLDPESNNMKPYFTTKANDGNDGKIYVWFDPCHMLKLLRNTLHDYRLLMSPTGRIEFSTLSRLLALQETTVETPGQQAHHEAHQLPESKNEGEDFDFDKPYSVVLYKSVY